jgi:hypothetical protein
MSRMTTWLNRVLMSLVFLLTGTRGAVARIFPAYDPDPKPASEKVFALTEAAWLELRGDGPQQDAAQSNTGQQDTANTAAAKPVKGSEAKKAPPKGCPEAKPASPVADDAKAKTGDKTPAAKAGDNSKPAVTPRDDAAVKSAEEKKQAAKTIDCRSSAEKAEKKQAARDDQKPAAKLPASEEESPGGGDGDMGGTGG